MIIHSHNLLPATGLPFVAVCGITCQSQADRAVSFGARCLLFDFVPDHLHAISAEHAACISSANVSRMGRFAAGDFSGIRETMKRARLDFAVLQGACDPVAASWALGRERIVRAFSGTTVTQETVDAWTPHCCGLMILAEDEEQLRRIAGVKTALPRILSFTGRREALGGFRPDGIALEAPGYCTLLSELLAVSSA